MLPTTLDTFNTFNIHSELAKPGRDRFMLLALLGSLLVHLVAYQSLQGFSLRTITSHSTHNITARQSLSFRLQTIKPSSPLADAITPQPVPTTAIQSTIKPGNSVGEKTTAAAVAAKPTTIVASKPAASLQALNLELEAASPIAHQPLSSLSTQGQDESGHSNATIMNRQLRQRMQQAIPHSGYIPSTGTELQSQQFSNGRLTTIGDNCFRVVSADPLNAGSIETWTPVRCQHHVQHSNSTP